jgi:FKBP-type peptidyl-prolyl cis-trans isomerase
MSDRCSLFTVARSVGGMALAACFVVVAGACSGGAPEAPSCVGDPLTTESGVRVQDLECGTGRVAESGTSLSVNYVGRLANGEVFDSAYREGEPFPFALGAGQVIQGWDEGLEGMRENGIRRLVIPSELGYGADGAPTADIPPNATLEYEVELVEVREL